MALLKRLEVRNFKSIAKLTLEFKPGVTAFVGPNGAGKSNIIDAISFALGSNSLKTLRAKKLEDLIKHGEKEAQVSLTIGNGQEIEISRIINRKGKSIFRVNGRRCTRTEVLERLQSLGIYPDGLSIIMQGDVDLFVRMSPRERREIIDEIAGISEYEEKKKKALRELEDVEERLSEARIILGERKALLEELKVEADVARKYKALLEELENLRTTYFSKKLSKIKREVEELRSLKGKLDKEIEEITSEIKGIEKKIEELRKRRRILSKEILSKTSEELMDVKRGIEGISKEVESEERRKAEIEREMERIRADISKMELEGRRLMEEIEKRVIRKNEIDEILKKLFEERKTKEAELERARREIEERSEEMRRILEEKDKIERILEEKERKARELGERIAEIRATLKGLVKEQVEEVDLESLMTQRAELKRKLETLEKRMLEMQRRERELSDEYERLNSIIIGKRSRLAELEGYLRSLKGEEGAVSLILKLRDEGVLKGIIGAVFELLDYDEELEKAVHSALGQKMNFIVCEDERSAIKAIDCLKMKKAGRATFVPMNRVKPKGMDEKEREICQKTLGLLVEKVRFRPELRRVMEFLFSNTFLVSSLEEARKLGIGKARFVTLDGDVAEKTSTITGGYFKPKPPILRLKSEAERLREELEILTSRKREIVKEIEMIRKEIGENRRSRNELKGKLVELEARIAYMKKRAEEVERIKRRNEEIDKRRMELEGELKRIEEEKQRIEGEIEGLKSHVSKLKVEIPKDETYRRLMEELEALISRVNELSSEKARVESEIKFLKDRVAELRRKRDEGGKVLRELGEELEGCDARICGLKAKLKELIELDKKISGEIGSKKDEMIRIEEELGALEEKYGRRKFELKERTEKMQRVMMELARKEAEIGAIEEELRGCSGIVLELGIEEAFEKMKKVEIELEKIGPVNMKAPELYEEKKKEVEHLESRIERLERERSSILGLIDEIEKRKVEVFMEALETIARNFSELFEEVFEGEGKIVLENPEKPFESGLLFKVKPKGKEIKYLEQLSGGERALTAILFLFSILQYKPSPFYVLDEADATLDKRNSEKFANLIKRLSKKSQFIIVSHNDVVLSKADVIYGVSMQNKSTVAVALDMKKYVAKKT